MNRQYSFRIFFYMTPVIYFTAALPDVLVGRTLKSVANWGPTGGFVVAFHNLFYDGHMPAARLYLTFLAITSFTVGMWIFGRLSPRFAEEM